MSDRDTTHFNPPSITGLHSTTPPKGPLEASSVAEFEKLVGEAKGPVVLDLVTEGCGFCEEAKPVVDKLAKGCDVTVIRVDGEKVPELAERFNVEGFPTTLFAQTPAELTPGKAEEVDPTDASFKRRLKCARTKKGGES